MALYTTFTSYDGSLLATNNPTAAAPVTNPFTGASVPAVNLLPTLTAGHGGDQVLNIGSQSSGAGAGRATFEPLAITRDADSLSHFFFVAMCAGTPWQYVDVFVTAAATKKTAPTVFEAYRLGLVAIDHIERKIDGSSPTVEEIHFEYGGILYGFADPKGSSGTYYPFTYDGWNRVKNVRWDGSTIS